MSKLLMWWAGIWIVIGIFVYSLAPENPDVLWGVAAAAGISLFFLVRIVTDEWEGEIIEVKDEQVYVPDDDGGSTEIKHIALVKQPNGKIKKVDAHKDYVVGNYLMKKKGQTTVAVLEKAPAK